MKLTLHKLTTYILCIFPLSLVVGPLAGEICMNLITVFVIKIIAVNKDFNFFKKKKYIFLILFYFIILISAFLSNYNNIVIFKSLAYLRYILFIFAVTYLIAIDKKVLKIFFEFLFFTLLIVIIDGYFQSFFGKNLLGFEKIRHDRISGFFDEKLVLGSYLLKFLIIHTYLFSKNITNLNTLKKKLKYSINFFINHFNFYYRRQSTWISSYNIYFHNIYLNEF